MEKYHSLKSLDLWDIVMITSPCLNVECSDIYNFVNNLWKNVYEHWTLTNTSQAFILKVKFPV
jgi:hypothetical protein